MKNLTLIASLVAACGFAGMAQAASTGTVNFSGILIETTCDVSVDEQGADAIVTLPTVGIGQLTDAGMTAGRTGFNMKLSDCPFVTGGGRVAAFFEAGSTVDLLTGRLKNASGTAENVDLVIYDGTVQIKPGKKPTVFHRFAGNPSTMTIPYAVAYYANGPTTAGTVRSTVVYSISYS